MLENIDLKHVMMLDIETIPQHAYYTDLPERTKELWASKTQYVRKDQSAENITTMLEFMQNSEKLSALAWAYLTGRRTKKS